MTASTATIRTALAGQLRAALTNINVATYPDDTKPPRIVVNDSFDSIDYEVTVANNQAVVRYALTVELAGTSADSIAKRMEEILSWDGDESIYAALTADRTLGGVVTQIVVPAATRSPDEPDRAEIPVEIRTSKT